MRERKNIGIGILMFTGIISMLSWIAFLTPTQVTSAATKRKGSWLPVLTKIRRRTARPISRSPGVICLISPEQNRNLPSETLPPKPIYSTRPLFLWDGNINKIALSNSGEDDYFWSDDKTQQKSFVIYRGQNELLPGKSYEWFAFKGSNPIILSQFKIMDARERQQITNELKVLEKSLLAKGANKETIAVKRADYFSDKELWSDVYQELYSISNPPPELLQELEKLPKEICETKAKN